MRVVQCLLCTQQSTAYTAFSVASCFDYCTITDANSVLYNRLLKLLLISAITAMQRQIAGVKNRSYWFTQPVDPIKDNVPTYFVHIKHPMDLGTIRSKVHYNIHMYYLQLLSSCYLKLAVHMQRALQSMLISFTLCYPLHRAASLLMLQHSWSHSSLL
jgi:Bromodomain